MPLSLGTKERIAERESADQIDAIERLKKTAAHVKGDSIKGESINIVIFVFQKIKLHKRSVLETENWSSVKHMVESINDETLLPLTICWEKFWC